MHAHPRSRRAFWTAVTVAVCVGGIATVATAKSSTLHLGGKWTGSYSGAYSGTLTINWTQTGSKLAGSIILSNPKGTYRITGSVNGSSINFGAVTAGATYTGSVSKSGLSMSGKYKAGTGGTGTWGAKKYVPKKKKKT